MNISEQSVFGIYDQAENQVTTALLKIFEADENETILNAMLQDIDGTELPEKSLKIETQPENSEGKSRPDGKLSCRYAFDIYIESKLGNLGTDKKTKNQLNEHCELLEEGRNVKLLYITKDNARPEILPKGVLWTNWKHLYEIINSVYDEEDIDPVLDYLINQFYLLLRTNKLYDDSQNRVIIVGGSWGEPVAKEYGFYACQPNRSFKDAKYLAFYNRRKIKYLFEIKGERKSNVDLRTLPEDLVSKRFFSEKDPNYSGMRCYFKLELVKEFSPAIESDSIDRNGRRVAFVRNRVYTTYDKIMNAKKTSDLK
jgi:hypothetical protein